MQPYISPREQKLSQLEQLNRSDAQDAQSRIQQQQADTAQQASMLDQFSKLYGIQQQQQQGPEHMRNLQLQNEALATKNQFTPDQMQAEIANLRATGAHLGAETNYQNQLANTIAPRSAADVAHLGAETTKIGLENADYPLTQQSHRDFLAQQGKHLASETVGQDIRNQFDPQKAQAEIAGLQGKNAFQLLENADYPVNQQFHHDYIGSQIAHNKAETEEVHPNAAAMRQHTGAQTGLALYGNLQAQFPETYKEDVLAGHDPSVNIAIQRQREKDQIRKDILADISREPSKVHQPHVSAMIDQHFSPEEGYNIRTSSMLGHSAAPQSSPYDPFPANPITAGVEKLLGPKLQNVQKPTGPYGTFQ